MCVPLRLMVAFGEQSAFYPWADERRESWGFPLPDGGITELRGVTDVPADKRPNLIEMPWIDNESESGEAVSMLGIRSEESPARQAGRRKHWIRNQRPDRGFVTAMPIINWPQKELWRIVAEKGWDWNRAYMRMWQSGMPYNGMRIGPMFCEQAMGNAGMIRKWDPELWHAASRTIEAAESSARYGNTALCGRGGIISSNDGGSRNVNKAMSEFLGGLSDERRKNTKASIALYRRRILRQGGKASADKIVKMAGMGGTKGSRLVLSALVDDFELGRWTKRGTVSPKDIIYHRRKAANDKRKAADRRRAMDRQNPRPT